MQRANTEESSEHIIGGTRRVKMNSIHIGVYERYFYSILNKRPYNRFIYNGFIHFSEHFFFFFFFKEINTI